MLAYLLLELQHLSVLLALPVSEFLRVLPHLPHQLCTLSLHCLWDKHYCLFKLLYNKCFISTYSDSTRSRWLPVFPAWVCQPSEQMTLWPLIVWTAQEVSSSCLLAGLQVPAVSSSAVRSAWKQVKRVIAHQDKTGVKLYLGILGLVSVFLCRLKGQNQLVFLLLKWIHCCLQSLNIFLWNQKTFHWNVQSL